MLETQESLTRLNADQLRELAHELIARIAEQSKTIADKDSDILYRQAKMVHFRVI
jgi:hypothetical protein